MTLAESRLTVLADVVGKIRREEKYRALHGATWMRRLAENTPEARARLEATLPGAWTAAGSLFEPLSGEDELKDAGYIAQTGAELQTIWRERVGAFFRELGVPVPAVAPSHAGGRRGEHTADFDTLWDEMTIVYRIDPAARW